jgi:DNA-binding response OmpR family regulator
MKILVIEDEAMIADSIKKGLEQEKYSVDVAYDGEYGYDLATSNFYDLIILDLMLPKIDGLTICRSLREEKNTTPLLMLTAKSEVEDKVIGLNMGADDYLSKPFAFDELLARVKALLRRPKKMHRDVLVLGDLEMDVTNFEVKRSDKKISLTHREFMLLNYFMRNPNKVFNKDQIISAVWEYDSDILPNTVEVYIKSLRNKIDVPFSDKKPLIVTMRGFGYKLEN